MTGDLDELGEPWVVAFDEAWAAYRAGNFGIGAVLVDDAGTIVTRGRNRVTEPHPVARTIGGNMMAHAEMNAFAALDRFLAEGLDLYTTLEPCLMCAATSIMLRVRHVHFAAVDEFFEGLEELWDGHAYTDENRPARTGPLDGPVAAFARVLPLAFSAFWLPDGEAVARARRTDPDLVDLAAALPRSAEFSDLADHDDVRDAYATLRPHLPS